MTLRAVGRLCEESVLITWLLDAQRGCAVGTLDNASTNHAATVTMVRDLRCTGVHGQQSLVLGDMDKARRLPV